MLHFIHIFVFVIVFLHVKWLWLTVVIHCSMCFTAASRLGTGRATDQWGKQAIQDSDGAWISGYLVGAGARQEEPPGASLRTAHCDWRGVVVKEAGAEACGPRHETGVSIVLAVLGRSAWAQGGGAGDFHTCSGWIGDTCAKMAADMDQRRCVQNRDLVRYVSTFLTISVQAIIAATSHALRDETLYG